MYKTVIAGSGHYVPDNVIKNSDLEKLMDTSDEWIVERTGIHERRFGIRHKDSTAVMAHKAAVNAIADADLQPTDIDFIIFATLSPDYYFPGGGVLLQRSLGISDSEIAALDIRNQCSGFIYGLSVADQYIKSGTYKNILLVGAEMHSMGLDFSTRGRGVSVLFGDGAGAVVLQQSTEEDKGILSTLIHSDGRHAEELAMISPGSHSGVHGDKEKYGFSDNRYDSIFVTKNMLEDSLLFPHMNGKHVFKFAVQKFPEVIMNALKKAGKNVSDIDMLITHQANLRISQFVQKVLKLPNEKVFNNIMKYGNTTAASIPIALSEARKEGLIPENSLLCLAAFGSGFTWGSSIIQC